MEISDESVGPRFCLICGALYVDKHTDCPHENVVNQWPELAGLLRFGVNQR